MVPDFQQLLTYATAMTRDIHDHTDKPSPQPPVPHPSDPAKKLFTIDSIPESILIHTGDGHIVEANKQACRSLGYSREELLELTLQDIEMDLSEAGKAELILDVLAGNGPSFVQGSYRRKDGTTFPAETKTDVLEHNEENPLFICVIHNTNARPDRQRRLQDKHNLLRVIIDSIPEIICVKDGKGRWMLANTFDLRLFGLQHVNYRGKTDTELAEHTLPMYKTAFLACKKSDDRAWAKKAPIRSKEIIPVAEGISRVMDVYKIPLFHKDGERRALIVVGRDITKQHHIEQQIRENEARYRQLFEQAPIGILQFDANLHITDCNKNYLSLMQVNRDQLIGFDLRNIRDTKIFPVLESTLLGKKGRWEGEYRTTLSDITLNVSLRTTPLYDGHGNIQGGMALFEDMSLHYQAQEEKFRLMSAIAQASETIVITDTNGNIEYVNPTFEKTTGYRATEALGKNPRILKSGRHDASFYQDMWQTLCAGKTWKGHLVNKRKDGALFEEDATISPVRNRNGAIINYVAVKRDVTEEVALKKQLNHAMKMEAIGTLAGGIAHDFNNILSAVLGYAEMAKLKLDENDPLCEDLTQIIGAGQRAADLVRQILTFSRQEESDTLKPVKVQEIIKEVLQLLRPSLPATIELQVDIDPECGQVLADSARIHQVLMNICANAKQAMQESQGTLIIRLAEIDGDSVIVPLLHGQRRWLDLEITDTGAGMEPRIKERIFEPFFTTKQKGEGTGLGLSVVHGIVKSHGGEITVDSKPGQGTTFHVYLPVIDNDERKVEQAEQMAMPKGTERILIVDDEPMLVDIMDRLLSGLGYTVTSFTDSRLALEWFTQHQDKIDLVLTDMTMPHLTGTELAKKILAEKPQLPVILCSGYSEAMNAAKAESIGIQKFLAKPIDNRILAQSVRMLLDNQSIQSGLPAKRSP